MATSIMNEEQFSKRLTQLRMEKGVSARDMSLSLGQSEAYINRIENRKMMPSMPAFLNICEYLGITPKDYFTIENGVAPSRDLLNAYTKLSNLSRERQKHVIDIINDLAQQ